MGLWSIATRRGEGDPVSAGGIDWLQLLKERWSMILASLLFFLFGGLVMAEWMNAPGGVITANFTYKEAACNHCGRVLVKIETIQKTAEFAERVRKEVLGGRAMHINSWCRCPEHNRDVGGAEHSLHMEGLAIDFTVKDLTPQQVQIMCNKFQGKGKLIGGLGRYKGFTHIDRGEPRTWRG